MAVRKTTKKIEAEATVEAPVEAVAEDVIPYDKLSDEMRAIYDEAQKIQEKLEEEQRTKNAKITANLLAHFNNAKKTGKGWAPLGEKITELSAGAPEGVEETDLEAAARVAKQLEEIIVLIAGKHLTATMLKELDGDPIGFMQPLQDVFRLAKVGKA